MAQQPVDYDKIAAQHGGIPVEVDYDAIAQEAGRASTPSAPAKAEHPHARVGRIATDLLPTLGGIVGGIAGAPAGLPGSAALATLGGAAGRFGQRALQAIQGQPTPQGSALVQDAAIQGGMQGAAEGIGGGVAKVAGGAAKAVYRGYLKPSLSERLAPKADAIVTTAIEEGLPISRGGVATGNRLIRELRNEVTTALSRASGQLDLHTVADRVRSFAKRRYYKPGSDMSDYEAALGVAEKLDNHPSLGIPPGAKPTRVNVPLSTADEVKRALDTAITETGFGVTTGAKKTTEKFARREMRAEIERLAPIIGPLNARESKLIDTTRTIARAVEREANQNQLIGVKSIASAGVAGAAYGTGSDPVSALGYSAALRVGLHPAIASRVAMVAARASKTLGISAQSAARLAVYAVSGDSDQGEGKEDQ